MSVADGYDCYILVGGRDLNVIGTERPHGSGDSVASEAFFW